MPLSHLAIEHELMHHVEQQRYAEEEDEAADFGKRRDWRVAVHNLEVDHRKDVELQKELEGLTKGIHSELVHEFKIKIV